MQKFEPFQKVIVRNIAGSVWSCDLYSHKDSYTVRPHYVLSGSTYTDENILPYEGNEHLLGTTNSPEHKWEPKPGELVAVKDMFDHAWRARVFVKIDEDDKYQCFCAQDDNDGYASWDLCEPLRKHFTIPEK